MTVVRSPTASTTPEYFEGSTSMKSPTPYWFSKRMKKPAMMSVKSLCAENAMIRMISVAPAAAETRSRTRIVTRMPAAATKKT